MKFRLGLLLGLMLCFTAMSLPAQEKANDSTATELNHDVGWQESNTEVAVVLQNVATDKTASIVDSLQAVAKVLTDPELKDLVIKAADHIKEVPKGGDANNWFTWITGLFSILGALVAFILSRFGGWFNRPKKE